MTKIEKGNTVKVKLSKLIDPQFELYFDFGNCMGNQNK